MNILIVGGTGTIGTHLVHSLSKQDYNIFLLSRNPKKYYKKFDAVSYTHLTLPTKA